VGCRSPQVAELSCHQCGSFPSAAARHRAGPQRALCPSTRTVSSARMTPSCTLSVPSDAMRIVKVQGASPSAPQVQTIPPHTRVPAAAAGTSRVRARAAAPLLVAARAMLVRVASRATPAAPNGRASPWRSIAHQAPRGLSRRHQHDPAAAGITGHKMFGYRHDMMHDFFSRTRSPAPGL